MQCRNGNIIRRHQRLIRKIYVHLSTPVNKTGAEQPDQESRDEDSDSDETIPYKEDSDSDETIPYEEPEEELPPRHKRRINPIPGGLSEPHFWVGGGETAPPTLTFV